MTAKKPSNLFNVRLRPELRAAIRQRADELYLSESAFVRSALAQIVLKPNSTQSAQREVTNEQTPNPT